MKSHHELHADQVAFWNGKTGGHWAEEQERIDAMLAPVLDVLIAQAKVRVGEAVLDVGCGTGASSIELTELVGPKGEVIGLDVSAPMLERARVRSHGIANLHYIHADAAAHTFTHPVADLLFSRFGVMFFGDPAAAFANLKRALKPGARVAFACWRKMDENKWMQIPLHAAYEHVERMPKPGPDDPGPLSFADPDRVTRILTAAGFAKPRFTPVDLMLDIAVGGGLEGAVRQAMTMGPASRALQDQPESVLANVAESMRKALMPHAHGNSVKLAGAIWVVTI
jgi:SAM-dependent methyltransferase